MWIGEADLYRGLSARKNERLAEAPRHSLESYCGQEHDAAFDALPDVLEFGEAVFVCCAVGRLVEEHPFFE